MTKRLLSAMLLSSAIVTLVHARAAQEELHGLEKLQHRTFDGFLYAGTDRHVWYGHTRSMLGMWSTEGLLPSFRLSPAEAERLAPLVNHIGDLRDDRRIFDFRLYLGGYTNPATLEQTPKILVRFEGGYRLAESVSTEWGDAKTFEIVSARLVRAEFVSAGWLRAWRQLDQALEEIVTTSLTAPNDDKRRQLVVAIEKGSQALNTMVEAATTREERAVVRRINPKAQAVSGFRRHAPSDWWRQLEKYIARLRIQPQTALPPVAGTALPPLAQSVSPGEFGEKIEALPAAVIKEDAIFYSQKLRRAVYVREFVHITHDEVRSLREEASKQLEDRKRREAETREYHARKRSETLKELALVICAPGDDAMAEKMILGGVVIEKVIAGHSLGFRPGDIVLPYKRVYDLVMGDAMPGYLRLHFRGVALHAWGRRPWPVLRGNRLVNPAVQKP